MFEDMPLISLNIRILRFLSLIYECSWRGYACLFTACFLVFTMVNYMFQSDDLTVLIMNSYMLVLWVNTIARGALLLYDHVIYEDFIADMVRHYREILQSKDPYERQLVYQANKQGTFMARGNLFLGTLTCMGFIFYPLFAEDRILPFGSKVPNVDWHNSPFYEFWYFFEVVITPMGCCMYIPYTNLIVAFIMFGIVMCKCLQHRLRKFLSRDHIHPDVVKDTIVECIKYQKHIISYISTVNSLCTYIFLLEFLAFGTLLCALLFLLIIVESSAEVVIVSAYITMIFAQILALYWYANELREQNLAIASAAYETEWFTFQIPVQKQILMLILRAQKPNSIMVGNIYPMTLELFQALLNASYSYFTLLKRVYAK